MNVEIGAEAAQFPEKEYIYGIAVAVQPALNKRNFDHRWMSFYCIKHKVS
jgi:hypothetical protein